LTYVYYYDIMSWGVIDAPRGSYMAKATSSRESSNKPEVSLYSDTLADSERAKNHPEPEKGTDSPAENIEKRARRASAARHARKCTVCHHKDREFIDQDYLRWLSPKKIAREYAISHQSVVYRHADATGLRAQRRASLRATLENFIEQAESVRATAGSVVAAVRLYAQINDQGQWTPPVKRYIIEHRSAQCPDPSHTKDHPENSQERSSKGPATVHKNSGAIDSTGGFRPVVTITAGSAVPFSASSNKFPAVPVASLNLASDLPISNREHVELEHVATH
jgi:hypothetical protein